MKSIVIIVATLLLPAAIQATSPSFATGTEPVIRVEPSTYIASSAGETFSINVSVTDAEDVNG
jgi:BioD-like phosphotransacetylase family protein